jgi:zinc transport system substrate-binding protein
MNGAKILRLVTLLVAAGVILGGCDKKKSEEDKKSRGVIYTTFYPTKYFAERIGGEAVEVVCPVPDDEGAIFWQPDRKMIEEYQKADLIIINGAEFAKWVLKVSLPETKVVNTAKPFEDEFIVFENAIRHSHGLTGEHAHEGIDGHTWLDPVNAKIQAQEIKKAMASKFGQHKEEFERGFAALAKDLDAFDAKLRSYTKTYKNEPILASHPAYNYVARRYGWNVKNLDLDPEEVPSDETFNGIKEMLKSFPAKYLLWEAYPLKEIAERFKSELGIDSVEFSPCELLGKEAIGAGLDYLTVMKQNLENIEVVFKSR